MRLRLPRQLAAADQGAQYVRVVGEVGGTDAASEEDQGADSAQQQAFR